MTLDSILTFHEDRIHVFWDSEKDSTNFVLHHIYLYYTAYAFIDCNKAYIYDEGHSSVDPSNPDNDEERHAIIGLIYDVSVFVALRYLARS